MKEKFPSFFYKYSGLEPTDKRTFDFQPLADIHLHSNLLPEIQKNGSMQTIYLFLTVAFIILLIAIINYVNLSTARASLRIKEIGVRKIIGAHKLQLVKQLYGETIIVTFFSFLISLFIVDLILPNFNNFVERNISFGFLFKTQIMLYMIGVVILVGLISGLYHALILSSIKPLFLLNGMTGLSNKHSTRNILVAVQFILAIILIFVTLTVKEQISFINNTDLGYNKENIITVGLNGYTNEPAVESVKHEIEKDPNVVSVASSLALPNQGGGGGRIEWPGKPSGVDFEIYYNIVDYNFTDLYGIKIINGRNFSPNYPSDENNSIVINETAAKALGPGNPIGKIITYTTPWGSSNRSIIGVAKDFHMQNMHGKILPFYFVMDKNNLDHTLSIKIKPNTEKEVLPFLKNTIEKFQPDYPFNYKFFNDVLYSEYSA